MNRLRPKISAEPAMNARVRTTYSTAHLRGSDLQYLAFEQLRRERHSAGLQLGET